MKHRSILICIILSVCFLFTNIQGVSADSVKPDENGVYRPTIYINGVKQDLKGSIPPSGNTLVPFREFFSTLNIQPNFNNNTKTLTASNGETTISLTAGKTKATLNGNEITLLQSPEFVEYGIMYVNLRFIAEAFDGKVSFDKSSLTIYIEFNN